MLHSCQNNYFVVIISKVTSRELFPLEAAARRSQNMFGWKVSGWIVPARCFLAGLFPAGCVSGRFPGQIFPADFCLVRCFLA